MDARVAGRAAAGRVFVTKGDAGARQRVEAVPRGKLTREAGPMWSILALAARFMTLRRTSGTARRGFKSLNEYSRTTARTRSIFVRLSAGSARP